MPGYYFVFWCTCYYLALIVMDTVSQVKLGCKTVGFSQNRFNFQGLKHPAFETVQASHALTPDF